MDKQSIIIGIVITIACFTPIIIMTIKRKQREKIKLNALNEIAKQSGCKITEYEFCSDFALGLDAHNHKVFFYHDGKTMDVQKVDLSEVKNVYTDKKARIVSNEGESVSVIETVDLCFSPQNKAQTAIKLSLFDDSINPQLGDELQVSEKWSRKLNEHIRAKK